jgi:hypothetical protein
LSADFHLEGGVRVKMVKQVLIVVARSKRILCDVEHRFDLIEAQDAIRDHSALHKTDPTMHFRRRPIFRLLFDFVAHPQEVLGPERGRVIGAGLRRLCDQLSAFLNHRHNQKVALIHRIAPWSTETLSRARMAAPIGVLS